MVKPSELPFYEETKKHKYTYVAEEPGVLEKNIQLAREGAMTGMAEVNRVRVGALTRLSEIRERATVIYETGKAHSLGAYNQLLDDEGMLARVGVIAGGGALGLVIGTLRGRMLKRLLYTGIGAGAGTAICYPAAVTEAGTQVYGEGRRTALIAYNFVTGVPDPGAANSDTSSNLIASSIRRVTYFLARKAKEFYSAISSAAEIPKTALTSSPVVPDASLGLASEVAPETPKTDSPREASSMMTSQVVFFAAKSSGSSDAVEGDVGQSNPEDEDMYSTRSS